jgi:hypothetical protein
LTQWMYFYTFHARIFVFRNIYILVALFAACLWSEDVFLHALVFSFISKATINKYKCIFDIEDVFSCFLYICARIYVFGNIYILLTLVAA